MKAMMRALALLTVTASLFAEEPLITARDIAQHLGIQASRIPATSLPSHYGAALWRVKQGKVEKCIGAYGFSQEGDLVVCGHEEKGEMVVTLTDGRTSARCRAVFGHSAFSSSPRDLGGGTYVLWADYKKDPKGVISITGNIEDVADGVALKIRAEPDSGANRAQR